MKEIETNENKELNKANIIITRNKINNKDSYSVNKNRLVYEKFNKKINGSLYNNYYNMKTTKPNSEKNASSLNKTLNRSYFAKSGLNKNNQKKKNNDKKISQYASKVNNNNKYQLNNNDIKGYNKYQKNNFDRIYQKRGSIPEDNIFNFNKVLTTRTKYQTIYKPKKEENKTNFYNQLTIITSTIKNDNNNNNNFSTVDRNRLYSVSSKFSSNKILSLDNIMNSYLEIKEKKDKVIKFFKDNQKISSKEQALYILSTSPILRLNEQIILYKYNKF